MALKDLLAQMKGQVPEGKKKKEEDLMDRGLPSNEELQDTISRRRKSADEVTDYLSQKGYPTLGAVAGTVTDLSADLIPKTREEYGESLVGGSTGTVSKIAGKMPSAASKVISEEAKQEARQLWNGMKGVEKDAWGNKFDDFLKANWTKPAEEAAETVTKKAASSQDLSDLYPKSAEKRTRLMTDDRKMGVQKMVDPEMTRPIKDVGPQASKLIPEEKAVKSFEFRKYDGPTIKDEIKSRTDKLELEELRKRMGKK